ncbi:MAG: hypothetical protein RID09_06010 [Coleofasciculus sp. G1-WW12-02]|uniref:hypothetical protein n=1 Tax=Coleofasciculus sp. G1-WW12-02 TaxID=3068483 RepID=UPI0032F180CA
MHTIIDTQVLSYCFKEVGYNNHNQHLAISAITANEFLLAQPQISDRPDYYVMHPVRYSHLLDSENTFWFRSHLGNPKTAKMGTRRTDQVIIDFSNQFPPYREFGNEAISEIINGKHFELYKLSISHLSKQKQKYLKKRMKYILDNNYYCYSLNRLTIEQALDLFSRFIAEHNCKGNVRNTVNDILILATALERGKQLLTHDNLLNRFAAEYYDAPIQRDKNELLIDFSIKSTDEKKNNKESKGYINQGWSYSVRNNRVVQGA